MICFFFTTLHILPRNIETMIVGAPILLIYFQIQGGSYSEEEEGACKIVLKKLKLGVLSNIHHLWVWIIYTMLHLWRNYMLRYLYPE